MKKNILSGLVLGAALVFLMGCGNKNNVDINLEKSQSSQEPGSQNLTEEKVKLPKPTGQVDDAVNSIIDEASAEKDQAVSDTDMAKSAADSSQEINDLSNSYDQNEIQ